MSSFSDNERRLARILGYFPFFKKIIKKLYSRLVFIRFKTGYKYQSEFLVEKITEKLASSFFGYYDKSPSNANSQELVYLVSDYETSRIPSGKVFIELAVFDPQKNIIFRATLKAYNWQQGARAHWLNDDLFIVNDYDSLSNKYISRVFSIKEKQEVKKFVYPVQDSFKTSYFLSINYRRLMSLRPDYGYRNVSSLNQAELSDLDNDGIWKIDFETGESSLLVSLAQACAIDFKDDFKIAIHKFNHVMISPSGEHFIFMHRYLIGKRRFDRLFLANSLNGELELIVDNGMISHCFWLDENNIIGYMRGDDGRDGYWKISLSSGKMTPFFQDALAKFGDGHPHVHGDWIVTDTYPNKARMQTLILINWKTGELKELGKFFHPFKFEGESRCDLHPRFSSDGKTVFFDSVFSEKRQLYKMKIF